eukprot:XP_022282228.1 basic proline-rich protein-like [Canis lupus familiaris]
MNTQECDRWRYQRLRTGGVPRPQSRPRSRTARGIAVPAGETSRVLKAPDRAPLGGRVPASPAPRGPPPAGARGGGGLHRGREAGQPRTPRLRRRRAQQPSLRAHPREGPADGSSTSPAPQLRAPVPRPGIAPSPHRLALHPAPQLRPSSAPRVLASGSRPIIGPRIQPRAPASRPAPPHRPALHPAPRLCTPRPSSAPQLCTPRPSSAPRPSPAPQHRPSPPPSGSPRAAPEPPGTLRGAWAATRAEPGSRCSRRCCCCWCCCRQVGARAGGPRFPYGHPSTQRRGGYGVGAPGVGSTAHPAHALVLPTDGETEAGDGGRGGRCHLREGPSLRSWGRAPHARPLRVGEEPGQEEGPGARGWLTPPGQG